MIKKSLLFQPYTEGPARLLRSTGCKYLKDDTISSGFDCRSTEDTDNGRFGIFEMNKEELFV